MKKPPITNVCLDVTKNSKANIDYMFTICLMKELSHLNIIYALKIPLRKEHLKLTIKPT